MQYTIASLLLAALVPAQQVMLSVHRATRTFLLMAMLFEEQPLHTVLIQMHGLELTMVWITDQILTNGVLV